MLGLPFFLAFFGGTRLGMYCTFVHQALRCYVDQGMRRLTYEILGALTLGKISATLFFFYKKPIAWRVGSTFLENSRF